MDVSEYMPMFLAEAREHLQELNLAVVRIEETPDDQETVNEIFRIAHSMKGMSATMGFARMAALTHRMEDVFELLRQRTGGLPRDAIDVLLECLDVLEEQVGKIEQTGAEDLAPAALIERLQSLVRERTPEQKHHRKGGPVGWVERIPPEVVAERAGGRRIVHVEVALGDECSMPSVRAFMVLNALGEQGSVLASFPAVDKVDAFDGGVVEAWLAAEADDDAVHAAATNVADVAAATVDELSDEDFGAEPAVEGEGEAVAAAPAAKAERGTGAAPRGKATTTSVRVDAARLDQLMHFMGELVVHRTHVESLAGQADVPGLSQAMADLSRASQSLQSMVMQVRMIPVEAVFLRFPRLVRDLSGKLGKQVELKLVGQDTELDRTVVDALGDPLVHLVRNALDHGLEPAADREVAGKPATATLEISAKHMGGNVVISVRDDGRGIDPAKVAAKAVERGLLTPEQADSVDQARAAELLFTAGFSTAETTSDISGRGVGMDAVRTTIRELGGDVGFISEMGVGTTAQIRLPLTLAIMAALLIEIDGDPFAVPLERVERTIRLEDHTVRSAAGSRMLVMRDDVFPLLDGGETLGRGRASDGEHAVIVTSGERSMALAVNKLIGQRELVTRPLPPDVSDSAAVSGGAVLSSGDIALIVDCDALHPSAGLAAA
ncbi:chemotaxis protein CheA [Capillimicrobium parvum]|uniref:Chemotaxis protein CheA n=1 Tax=Capillimicrobium parvum TaxID=2884022 RepID=A0A9E7BW85_9ACTN|nr:chemotaxis protein CheA [Capillimicrobium parvum]UGS33736.1 Chemotaxis protein CheA [Capillimicrobium parvum]